MIYIPCVKVHWSLKSNKVRTWFPKSTKLYITMVALISYAALNKALMDAVLTHNGTEAFWSRQGFLRLNKNSFMRDVNGLTYHRFDKCWISNFCFAFPTAPDENKNIRYVFNIKQIDENPGRIFPSWADVVNLNGVFLAKTSLSWNFNNL